MATLREMCLGKAAQLVEAKIYETLTYYNYPQAHWIKLKTNNPIERITPEIRRRTKVVGAVPDGESALMLVSARLRYLANASWETRRYISMDWLKEHHMEARRFA
ncbi:MAG: hypothetical protein RLZZ602_1934 [Pseudomonadota bacterium]